MAWPINPRPAKCLLVLRDQVNALAPGRSTASDGMIGDAAHASRKSDHNPDSNGVVTALDITHDPSHGMDSYKLAEQLLAGKDRRIKYVISNRKIASGTDQGHTAWVWRNYDGDNPHDLHVHISVKDDPSLYDSTDQWILKDAAPAPTPPTTRSTVKRGDESEDVKAIQRALMIDGIFGALTEIAVMQFQHQHGLYPDGVVGPYTWREIEALKSQPPKEQIWQTEIIATVFGGSDDPLQRSAYDNHAITDTELGVALPYRFSTGVRPRVEVKGPSGTATGEVIDVGPWNISDPYWETGRRPQAESGTDLSGRHTNGAGIDLTPALAHAVGVDGRGHVDWRFV